jgi:hypothetical protein
MKTKALLVVACMLLALLGLVSCARTRTDAAIIGDVQARVHEDAALASASISVQSSGGVVVLTGSVATDGARIAAENAARQTAGVKGVINNLQVETAAAAPPPPPLPEEAKAATRQPRHQRAARGAAAPASVAAAQPQPPPVEAQLSPPAEAASSQPAQAVAPQAPQPLPVAVTVPAGTRLIVRLIDPIDTGKNKEGDTFRASLDSPIEIDGRTVIPKYAEATARLVSAKSAGRFAGSSSVALVLTRIMVGDTSYDLQTGEYAQKGASRGSRTAKVVGGTAAIGAVIGAIAGGGKGAAVGAAAGAGAGTAAQALTKGQQIKLPAESILEFQLQSPLTVASFT